jgi:hypothetical protein
MPVRTNMQPLIDLLRTEGQAASSTETFNGIAYWSDIQLQDILDEVAVRSIVSGAFYEAEDTIFLPAVPKSHYADPDTIKVLVSGNWVASTGTWDTLKRELTTTQDVTAISARWISLNAALATFWQKKASQRSDYINVKGGQNKLDMKQEYEHCVQMATYYRARIWVRWQP